MRRAIRTTRLFQAVRFAAADFSFHYAPSRLRNRRGLIVPPTPVRDRLPRRPENSSGGGAEPAQSVSCRARLIAAVADLHPLRYARSGMEGCMNIIIGATTGFSVGLAMMVSSGLAVGVPMGLAVAVAMAVALRPAFS